MEAHLWNDVADRLEARLGRAPLFHEVLDAVEDGRSRTRQRPREAGEAFWEPWLEELLHPGAGLNCSHGGGRAPTPTIFGGALMVEREFHHGKPFRFLTLASSALHVAFGIYLLTSPFPVLAFYPLCFGLGILWHDYSVRNYREAVRFCRSSADLNAARALANQRHAEAAAAHASVCEKAIDAYTQALLAVGDHDRLLGDHELATQESRTIYLRELDAAHAQLREALGYAQLQQETPATPRS